MQANWVAITEITLVLGAALGWGFYELMSLRRYRKRMEREAAEPPAMPASETDRLP